jgi:hypothetical protein
VLTLLYAGQANSTGSGDATFGVAAVSGTGSIRISGSGSESFGVAGLDSSGSVNENNSGSITVPVSAFSGVGTERIVGSGGYVAAVPQFQGGQPEAPAPQIPQSGGGSVDGFVRWGPRPTVVKPIVPPIKPAAKPAVAGRGGIAVPVARTEGQGTLRLVLAAGDQTFGAPDIRGEGQHVRPVISGSLVMHAAASTYSGAGFQDLGPVEEEEMALLFAAAA